MHKDVNIQIPSLHSTNTNLGKKVEKCSKVNSHSIIALEFLLVC